MAVLSVTIKPIMLSVVMPKALTFYKVACFVKKVNNVFTIKSRQSKLVCTKRSTVWSLGKASLFRVIQHKT